MHRKLTLKTVFNCAILRLCNWNHELQNVYGQSQVFLTQNELRNLLQLGGPKHRWKVWARDGKVSWIMMMVTMVSDNLNHLQGLLCVNLNRWNNFMWIGSVASFNNGTVWHEDHQTMINCEKNILNWNPKPILKLIH